MIARVGSLTEAMALAIEIAKLGVRQGQRPFGTIIHDHAGRVIATASGTEAENDPTRHSEMRAIHNACRTLGGLLHGCTIVTTHEPCIMCCGAINHAKLTMVAWGSERQDLPSLFRDREYTAIALLRDTSRPPEVRTGVLGPECIELFDDELRPPGLHDRGMHLPNGAFIHVTAMPDIPAAAAAVSVGLSVEKYLEYAEIWCNGEGMMYGLAVRDGEVVSLVERADG